MAKYGTDSLPKHKREPLEDPNPVHDEVSEVEDFSKSMVKCVCPRCGKFHFLKMHWIGRGVPRKICQNCRDREMPLDETIF